MRLDELQTPAALVEVARLHANCALMRERARGLGVRLRPHVKTHKCVEIARLQHDARSGPITVSTLAEARHFGRAGFRDITLAVPLAPGRVPEALTLLERGVRVGVLVDHADAVAALERLAGARRVVVPVWLKVDCGYHRSGVDPEQTGAVDLAAAVAGSARLTLAGILTHAGHAYHGRDRDGVLAVARQERDVMVAFAARLRRRGIAVPEVSIGSTPTVSVIDDLAGITEVRPGNYAFFDAFQAAIGSCAPADCAFSVLTSVIGCFPLAGRLVVDAGALALSRDPGPTHVDGTCGFGRVCDLDGRELEGLRLCSLSQEHGVVGGAPELLQPFGIGDRLRVIPNHSCLAAACFARYHVVDGLAVIDQWRPTRGW